MGEVGDDLAAAIAEQFETFSEVALGNPLPTIDGEDCDGIVSEIEFDEIIAAGGMGEAGGFRLQVKAGDGEQELNEKPEVGTPVVVRGVELVVLSAILANGYWKIIAGDTVATE